METAVTELVLTTEQALQRSQSRGLEVAVLKGEFFEPVALTLDEVSSLMGGTLYVGLFNLSSDVPLPEHFDGLQNKTEREWQEMYGGRPRRYPYLLLPELTGLPPERLLAIAPLHRRHSRAGVDVLSSALEFRDFGWVTHFAIGSSKGVHVIGAFNDVVPAKPGNGYSFGLRLDIFMQAVTPESTRLSLKSFVKRFLSR